MRAFVTGGRGFVGRWLVARLLDGGSEVVSVDREDFDVCDVESAARSMREAAPDVVFHLAAQASVARSFEDPVGTYRANVLGTVAVLEAVRRSAPHARVVVASSAEVYGDVAEDDLPIREAQPLRPSSPYAASKVAQEVAAFQSFRSYGLEVVVVRSFNLVGPGQSTSFALASFAEQLTRIANGDGEPVLRVGNLDARRDLTDVRDAVEAYIAVAERGLPGEAYNLCSGHVVTIREALDALIEASGHAVRVAVDPDRFRPTDIPCLAGSADKIRTATGWEPRRSLAESMRALLASLGA
jgi:GDP-4-dehydro-6-deoxy-D-mannose reductase